MAPFLPLTTPRLLLRAFRPEDAPAFAAYRSHPDVARYQSWDVPYTEDQAMALIGAVADLPGPTAGEWIQVAVEHGGWLAGDVAVGLSDDGLTATIGFTLDPAAQGRGLATEAAGAVVDRLFEMGVHRVVATLDPANVASARVVESLGFRYEGRSLAAELVRGEWVDDERYALLAGDRQAWLARSADPPRVVELAEMTDELVGPLLRLATHHSQRRFVAPMLDSFADALFPELVDAGFPASTGQMVRAVPWMRAVLADGDVVAFVMVAAAATGVSEPYLWRLLVDRFHQRRGIGQRVIELLVQELRAAGHSTLLVSWVPGAGSPERFYLRLGFVPTGDIDDGEIVARLTLTR